MQYIGNYENYTCKKLRDYAFRSLTLDFLTSDSLSEADVEAQTRETGIMKKKLLRGNVLCINTDQG